MKVQETKEEIETRRRFSFEKIDREYYDINSPHYKDNNRYSWAVKAINEQINEDIKHLQKIILLNTNSQ